MLRILLMADSHLGFDLPTRPRIRRRRRGEDFLARHREALAASVRLGVDLVVHGGDVFDRPDVPPSLVHQAFDPVKRVADAGVPVVVVPGNHERSRIPHRRHAEHPGVHILDRPRTVELDLRGIRVSLAGFPYERGGVRSRFPTLVEESAPGGSGVHVHVLCIHHCVEGATVGPADYTFTTARDVIRSADIPSGFAAILSGHIHRHQVLTTDLRGQPLGAPVFYPGSIERTSVAEAEERKGYLLIDVEPTRRGGRVSRWEFVDLKARPMVVRDVPPSTLSSRDRAVRWIARAISSVPVDAVLRIRVNGPLPSPVASVFTAPRIRRTAPDTMNVEVVVREEDGGRRRHQPSRRPPDSQLALDLPVEPC